jgi:hypothetical protein
MEGEAKTFCVHANSCNLPALQIFMRRSRLNAFSIALSATILLSSVGSSPAAPPPRTQKEQTPQVSEAKAGPWGRIEWTPIYLEAPDSLLAVTEKPNSIPHWCFPGASGASLLALFERAGLPAEMRQRLLDPKRWTVQDDVVTIFVPVSDVEALTPEARDIIYAELARSPLNEFKHDPVFIIGGLDEWLRDTQLPAETQALIRKLTYHCGRALAFSDIRVLLTHAKSEAEVQHIFKTATRTRTLIATLKIPSGADEKQIIDYWTAGRPNSDIVPLIESLSSRSCATTLDITHLLPSFARRRLYTYPTPDLAVRGRMPDCHWTSLNFFKSIPQNYYLDTRLASAHVVENYTAVEAPLHFGDVLIFMDDQGNAAHSCVYIADDIVYTKNGENSLTPWILMRLPDVQDIYLRGPQWRMQAFREKIAQAR